MTLDLRVAKVILSLVGAQHGSHLSNLKTTVICCKISLWRFVDMGSQLESSPISDIKRNCAREFESELNTLG